MVHVQMIDLSPLGIELPNDRVRMVLAQPYLPREYFTADEPYQFLAARSQQQRRVLNSILDVAAMQHPDGLHTHFTVIPEYSIPGLEGIRDIDQFLRTQDWPNGSVVIGGTDGLTRTQYAELTEEAHTCVDAPNNGIDQVRPQEWVNCVVIWVKSSTGTVHRWLQPKIHPAWEERNTCHQRMFEGRSVYVFKGRRANNSHFLFGALVCFDWIARPGDRSTLQWILEALQRNAGAYQIPVTWVFVIERNRWPSHHRFLRSTEEFFRQDEHPNVDRNNACVVFVNTAGKSCPGAAETFGTSSLVLSPRASFQKANGSPPTFSLGGPRFRNGSMALRDCACTDIILREHGACIHRLDQINPGFVEAGAPGRALAIDNTAVFPAHGPREPRAPGTFVPAAIKWVNDALDTVSGVSQEYDPQFAQLMEDSHTRTVGALRGLESADATNVMRLGAQGQRRGPDQWDVREQAALQHIVRTLGILGVPQHLEGIGRGGVHAVAELSGQRLNIVAVRGTTHEECWHHAKAAASHERRQRTLLVSRDEENDCYHQRFGSILDRGPRGLRGERRITDAPGPSYQIGYRNLVSVLRRATALTDIAEGINGQLAA